MCIDAPESTTNSLSSGFNVDARWHLFSGDEKNAALSCSFNLNNIFGQLPRCLRGHLALATLSLLENDPQILERWGFDDEVHLGKCYRARDFGLEFWCDANFTRWIGLCMSEPFRRRDFSGFMSCKTQPNCRAFDDRRPVGARFNSWLRFLSGRPDLTWALTWLTTGSRTFSCQSFFFNIATALLSSFFWDLLVGCSSTWRCAWEHFSTNRQRLLVS